jgi:L-serine dehydratase
MSISTFDLFKVGIGPSSSHTVGPTKAAAQFAQHLDSDQLTERCERVTAELFGSLGAIGAGHGSQGAIILGLEGETPESVDVPSINPRIAAVRDGGILRLLGRRDIPFSYRNDLIFHRKQTLPFHSNGMLFSAYSRSGECLATRAYYSVGGGFVINEKAASANIVIDDPISLAHPFASGVELLQRCDDTGLSISALMLANERAWRSEARTKEGLLDLWRVMDDCIAEGILPGGLRVKRRAANLHRQRLDQASSLSDNSMVSMDWVTLYALAINEENASGGRVVTAPTNGPAGIIPAVLKYYLEHCKGVEEDDISNFLLTAAAIGTLYKLNASISGAEVGCQGEVGSACSMAAGALTQRLGGTPSQVENAAEIAMEHNLGLTCDPIGGLVQVPYIERNAMAAIKAIGAARMALRGNGEHFLSLDQVTKTMRDTGRDMQDKYKETARGGLAINVLEVPVNIIEC